MRRLAAVAVLAVVAGCAATSVYRDTDIQISSAAAFDPARYVGLWYEIARYPVPFQTGCVAATATYSLRPDGTIGVVNACKEGTPDGPVRQIEGRAEVTGPGRLNVRFDAVPFVKSPYWVLWTDDTYETAVVGVPSGRAGWVLSRTPTIRPDRWRAALEVLDFNGYDIARLISGGQPGAEAISLSR
ncbi:MAG: lipocalin family protein [Pseudomonadota bacterium]